MQLGYPFPGEAYMAGLLHNLGMYLLMGQDLRRYLDIAAEARQNTSSLEALEESRFGISHTKVGSIYAEKWSFPKVIVAAIKNHHGTNKKNTNPLVHIVSLASALAQGIGVGLEPNNPDDEVLVTSLEQLNLDRDTNRIALSRKRLLADP